MKNLLLILALFVGNSFSEDEYPIELTCEVGVNIIYVSIGETGDQSLVKAHPSMRGNKLLDGALFRKEKWQKGVKPRKTSFNITDEVIRFSMHVDGGSLGFFIISRLNGNLSLTGYGLLVNGQCFKGFKEYKQKKF
jgi:hypothetical protein